MKLPNDLKNFKAHGWWNLWGYWGEPLAGWAAVALLLLGILADNMGWIR